MIRFGRNGNMMKRQTPAPGTAQPAPQPTGGGGRYEDATGHFDAVGGVAKPQAPLFRPTAAGPVTKPQPMLGIEPMGKPNDMPLGGSMSAPAPQLPGMSAGAELAPQTGGMEPAMPNQMQAMMSLFGQKPRPQAGVEPSMPGGFGGQIQPQPGAPSWPPQTSRFGTRYTGPGIR